ncbi:hypothetical protein [Actinophytocola sp. NPDC049390]|uniref:hypothetical protein n=1 Tax=Actinophytocola sp. NPDC049390 TaxID=3363894 RepID=UPI0037900403
MTNVDISAARDVLRKHVGASLLKRLGGGKVNQVAVDAAAVAEIARDAAVREVAGEIEKKLDPEVAKVIAEYQVLFGDYQVYLTGLIRQTMEISKCCNELREYEFIRATVHGSDAASAASRLKKLLKTLNDVLHELHGHQSRLPLTADAQGLEPFKAFIEKMRNLIEDTKGQAAEVGEQFNDAVDFEVVKAIVRDKPNYPLEAAFYAVRSAIAGMSLAGDICGYFPNPYTTPVSIALRNVSRCLAIGEAILHRQAKALSNEKRVKEYLKKRAEDDKWDAHTKDPTLMARMLVDKRKAQLEVALLFADAAIGPVLDMFEYSDFAWDVVRQAIESSFVGYLDARITLLEEELGQKSEDSPAVRVAKAIGKEFLDEWKQDLFKVLNPLNAIKGAVLSGVGDRIARVIWEHLPIEPGQAVDGATLKAQMDELAEKIIGDAPKKDEAFAAKMAAEEKAGARPTEDKDGNAVEKVLSGVRVDEDNKPYRLVQIGGVPGALYLEDLDFRPAEAADKAFEPLAVLPSADSKGRAIDEVDLSVGFKVGHPLPQGMDPEQPHLWVRIGAVWGYLETQTEKFWPADVDPAAFKDWRKCVVERDGYYEDGTHVKGKWYRPFGESHAGYYLFLHKDGVTQEWARSQDNTGSGRGSKNTIASLTKPSDGFDLTRL